MEKGKISCSVQVLTLNSAKTLGQCLDSVKDFVEIIVLDGNSADNTLAIARRFTDKIYPQSDAKENNVRITDFAAVRNRGLALANFDWFLFIDSDEYLSPEAAEEIRGIIKRGPANKYFIYNLPRFYVLGGVVLQQMKPTYQPRFFYRPAVIDFKKRVHERVVPKEGYSIGVLQYGEYVPLEDIKTLRKKWEHYLDIEQDKTRDITPRLFLVKFRANIKKFLKYILKALFNRLVRPRGGMPFRYEFYNAFYHLQIIGRLFINLKRNIFKK